MKIDQQGEDTHIYPFLHATTEYLPADGKIMVYEDKVWIDLDRGLTIDDIRALIKALEEALIFAGIYRNGSPADAPGGDS